MQQYTNRNTRRGIGLLGTFILHAAALGVLVIVAFAAPPAPRNEEGIQVNFGFDETGFGTIEPSPPAGQQEASVPPASEAQKSSQREQKTAQDEALLSQNAEDAPAVKKVDPEAAKKRLEQIEAEKVRKAELEAERIKRAQEEAERKRIEAEQQRASDIMNKTKNALAGSRNSGTSSTSEGIAGGTGNQGVPTGSIDSKNYGPGGGLGNSGISYDLGGRGFKKVPLPDYNYQAEGKVVVEVSVDRSGKVVQAVPGYRGSNTLDENLLRIAKEAALQATFDPKPDAPLVQKGTITYIFKLK